MTYPIQRLSRAKESSAVQPLINCIFFLQFSRKNRTFSLKDLIRSQMLEVGQISVALALLLANPRRRLGYFVEEDLEMSKLQIMEFVKTKLESWEIKMAHNHGFLPFTCRCFRIWSMRSPTKSSCSVAKRVGLQQFPEPRKNMTDGDDFRKTEKNHLPRT